MDEAILGEAKEARDRLIAAQREQDDARADYHHAIRRLHASGASMREIAEALGISHQRVHQIVDEAPGGRGLWLRRPPRGARRRRFGGSLFHRFTQRARDAVTVAEQEARALGHEAVGSEDVLLGLLAAEEAGAARALKALGVDADAVRRRVEQGPGSPEGKLPFSPQAKGVLELSLREALALGHKYIGTEHLLLGLVRQGGAAADLLADLGADDERVRAEVERQLAA
jgi:Clp amino terminal domain, pathogenicity island component